MKQRVVRPLTDLKVVCYYGCQMVRPPRITGFTDFENPQTLDRIAAALGAEVQDWSYKATCCGASIGIGRKDIQETLTARLLDKARQTGAEAIVVSCPLCQANLDIIQRRSKGGSAPRVLLYRTPAAGLRGRGKRRRMVQDAFRGSAAAVGREGVAEDPENGTGYSKLNLEAPNANPNDRNS